ncbi:hypothetical protein N7457_009679 [Penicillium paradoxum]|uniref:uncharacterized protein n=1 Tax=Penicillium paradoxum TaxID=176176 RepID=UPI002549A4E0|nr:uncharacterized protein N7457_009679 [Penicillium paradoxum]KAJ5774783.1 hypothetical protein N7457_009679 [Penicillium paradoxum]
MRATYLFLSVAAPLALALVIPDETILAEIVSETRSILKDQDDALSKANVETSLIEISPEERGGWRRDQDWPDGDEYPGHEWPGYDEAPHRRWPGYEDDRPRHGWPGHRDDEDRPYPPHSRHPRPGDGEWPHRDDRDDRPCHRHPPSIPDKPPHRPHPIHRPIDACPGPLCRTDKTTWQLIRESAHTAQLAKLIADDSELVEILNSTETNHTFFAPPNHALERLLRGREGPTRKSMSNLLRYHIVDGRLPIDQISGYQTLPTKLEESGLGSKLPQRIVVREHHDGVVLNRKSLVVVADLKTKNGVIHIITTPLHPPPETHTLLHRLPHFNTFNSALARTKLTYTLDSNQRQGGTTFVPTNAAFRRLGGRINHFLFSPQGEKCLRALMQYHIVPNRTLYSDVLYTKNGKIQKLFADRDGGHGGGLEEDSANVRLETLLKDHKVAVDVERSEEVIMRLDGFDRVGHLDLLARDGVVHVLDRVLIPPRKIKDKYYDESENVRELMVEELVERLDDCVYEEVRRGEL